MTDTLGILLQTAPRGPMGPNPGPHGPMPYGGPGGGTMPWEATATGAGLLPSLLWLLVLVAVVAAVAYLVLRLLDERLPAGAGAMGVLERRYARGEIDEAEFERRRYGLAGETWPGRPEQ